MTDLERLTEEVARLRVCVEKIDAIRNDIIGRQSINWSRHIYPLVAALREAGYEGAGHEAASAEVSAENERLTAFVRGLARYLVANQAMQSIRLEAGDRGAQEWAALRALTPLFGYPTVDEAEQRLSDWLLVRRKP